MSDTQALARNQSQEMARPAKELSLQDVSDMTSFDLPQIAMIRHNMATSMRVTPDRVPLYDIALYCHAAKTLDLDPLLRQCYWIVRQGKGALQVGIDGYRAIAERSGVYAGSQAPEFRDWTEFVEGNKKYLVPGMARVTVWKLIGGRSCAFTGEAYWDEWYPGPGTDGFMYRKMPRLMLAKDAEAQALRKAFPAMLSKVEYAANIGAEIGDVAAPTYDLEAQRPQPRRRPSTTSADYDRIADQFYGAHDQPRAANSPAPRSADVLVEDSYPRSSASAVGVSPVADSEAENPAINSVRNALYQRLAELIHEAAEMDIPTAEYAVVLPVSQFEVEGKIQKLGVDIAEMRRRIAGSSLDTDMKEMF